MSLTIFTGKTPPEVGIVEWFRNPKFPNSFIEYPSGPLIAFAFDDFRSKASEFVYGHIHRYRIVRLSEAEATPVFEPGGERKFLKGRNGIYISYCEEANEIAVVPIRLKRLQLGGWVPAPDEYRHVLPWPCDTPSLMRCFTRALSEGF